MTTEMTKTTKGIILAGGNGTRLYPLTKNTPKALLPVYDKPMLQYPLALLMEMGIKDILIISTISGAPAVQQEFKDGSHLGINISYDTEPAPLGIGQAFTIGKEFIGDDNVCLVLGDNIIHCGENIKKIKESVNHNKDKGATIFAQRVDDPERFGIVEFDNTGKVISIEEKPIQPKSNYASIGLYFYPSDVVKKAQEAKPSARGEYEITDINNEYLKENRLNVVSLPAKSLWADAGTHKSLLQTANQVQYRQNLTGKGIAFVEEIAWKNGWINDVQFLSLFHNKKGPYADYLKEAYKQEQQRRNPKPFEYDMTKLLQRTNVRA